MYRTAAALLICLICAVLFNFCVQTSQQLASVFFHDSVTAESLREKYDNSERGNKKRNDGEKVKILVVPGHDKQYSGTTYRGLQEVELTVDLGERLYELLQKEPSFDVYLTQTKEGYVPEFSNYFEQNREGILKFIADQKNLMNQYVESRQVERVVHTIRNIAPDEMGVRLYGINKWANENDIDIVIHVHFNDYPGRPRTGSGKYSGFSIFVPESQYSNAKGSKSVAEFVYNRLKNFYPVSDMPKEDTGVIEDQELIALGSNNSLDGVGMLVEYGYIYEPGIVDISIRNKILDDLAFQTYLGVMDFFGKSTDEVGEYGSRLLPHEWQDDLKKGDESLQDIVSLQAALIVEGVYPPPGETKNNCPISGRFGSCTERSVRAFQEKHGIVPAQGFVGELTRMKLNELY